MYKNDFHLVDFRKGFTVPAVPLKNKLGKRDLKPATQFDKSKTQQKLLAELKEYLADVGRKFTEYLREKLGTPYPTKRSKAGDYPAKRTGSLQASVGYRVQGGTTKATLVVGIIRDILKGGETRRPTLYATELEFRLHRRLVASAWAEFSKKLPSKMRSDYLTGTLDVVRLKNNQYQTIDSDRGGRHGFSESIELRGYEALMKKELRQSSRWHNWRASEGLGGPADVDEILEAAAEARGSGEWIGRPSLMAREELVRALR